MDLPKAIQAQLDEAAEIEKQLKQPETPPETTDTDPVADPAPEPAPEAVPQSEPASEPKQEVPEETWERRFKTLAGKYEAETPRLHQQIRDLQTQLESQAQALIELQSRPEPTPEPAKPLVTSDDEESFGADLVNLMRRVASEATNSVADRLARLEAAAAQLNTLQQKVTEVSTSQAQTAEERFYAKITDAVPDWQEVDKDERWLAWLAEYDPIVGGPRQGALNAAGEALDAGRVIALFNQWKAAHVVPQQQAVAQNQAELQRQVAPSKSKATTAKPVTEKIWSAEEYERAFDPRLRATMSNDEVSKLQAEADRAAAEGRVRW